MVSDPERSGPGNSRRYLVDRLEQLGQPLAAANRGGNDRDSQLPLQSRGVNRDSVPARLVHKVETHHYAIGYLENLEDQIEVPLQPRRIDYDQRDVGLAEEDEVARDFLVGASGLQRIGPRKVDDLDLAVFQVEDAFGARDRLAGPVARVLAQASQRVEDSALAGVGIAREGDEIVPRSHRHAELDQVLLAIGAAGAAPGGGSHAATSPDARRTRIHSACSWRSAMSAPRMS